MQYPHPYPQYQHTPQLDVNGIPKPAIPPTQPNGTAAESGNPDAPTQTPEEDQKNRNRGGEEYVKDSAATSVLDNHELPPSTPIRPSLAPSDEVTESPGWQTVPSRKHHRSLKTETSQDTLSQQEQQQPAQQPQPAKKQPSSSQLPQKQPSQPQLQTQPTQQTQQEKQQNRKSGSHTAAVQPQEPSHGIFILFYFYLFYFSASTSFYAMSLFTVN